MSFNDALALHQAGRLAEAETAYRALLASVPNDAKLLTYLGVLRAERGDLREGLALLHAALLAAPQDTMARYHYGSVLLASGQMAAAIEAFHQVLKNEADHPDALFALGNAEFGLGHYEAAAGFYTKLDSIQPGRPEVLLNLGSALQESSNLTEALAVCDRVLALLPGHPGALNNKGNALRLLKRPAEALVAFDEALKADPNYDLARFNRATVLETLRRYEEALRECDRVLLRAANPAAALSLRGSILLELDRFDEALASFERALSVDPAMGRSFHGRIKALMALTRWGEALVACDVAVARSPNSATARNNRAAALVQLRRYSEAEAEFSAAVALEPASPELFFNRAGLAYNLSRLDDAYADVRRALEAQPDYMPAFFFRFGLAAHLCDWSTRAEDRKASEEFHKKGERVAPFLLTYDFDAPQMQLDAAQRMACPVRPAISKTKIGPREKLRVAYLSADFRNHPVTHQAIELFESHDRSRVETIAVALLPMPDDALGARLRGAFDSVVDASEGSDRDIARKLAELEIDIAVELGGYTDKARPGVLSWRPAPVSACYLGYPGTLGSRYIDYVVGDSIIIPPGDDKFYTEKVVRLPVCLMPFDSTAKFLAAVPSRAEEGLPENGFVFCNFNKTDKITPAIFARWMTILKSVPQSVLWLGVQNETAQNNLKKAAQEGGVDPARLVFAKYADTREQHLARIKCADLFLDTFPYNAHATASDFLSAGVPVLTVMGNSFASRVAASILTQVKAEGLIAPDFEAYEKMALDFAAHPEKLLVWRRHLETHKRTQADTKALATALEDAYVRMWERRVAGEKPEGFSL